MNLFIFFQKIFFFKHSQTWWKIQVVALTSTPNSCWPKPCPHCTHCTWRWQWRSSSRCCCRHRQNRWDSETHSRISTHLHCWRRAASIRRYWSLWPWAFVARPRQCCCCWRTRVLHLRSRDLAVDGSPWTGSGRSFRRRTWCCRWTFWKVILSNIQGNVFVLFRPCLCGDGRSNVIHVGNNWNFPTKRTKHCNNKNGETRESNSKLWELFMILTMPSNKVHATLLYLLA